MKKSKIIVPAIAILCLGAAASVSGTVAWFSAARTADSKIDTIAVVNPEGDLTCSATAGYNTKLVTDGIAMEADWKMRDASVQAAKGADPIVWRATNVDTSGSASTFAKVEPSYIYNNTKKICYAATWTLSFTVGGSSVSAYNIKFNPGDSDLTVPSGADLQKIYSCYRLAIISDDACAIWAPNDATTITYVNGTSTTGTYTRATDPVTLGTIYSTDVGDSTKKTKLTVKCIMWFEGTAENCKSTNLGTGVSATGSAKLNFSANE